MRDHALLAIVATAACGGSPKPVPPPEPAISAKPVTRVPVEDTEPDDGMQVVSAHGHMEPSVVEAGISPHTSELSDCYTSRVGKRRWLGGHVQLHWDIRANGDITAVKLAESDLGAWPVEKCLLEIARNATFGRPVGGDADFVVPLDFATKGTKVGEMWDEDKALRAVGGQLAKLDNCAKAKGHPALPDDVTITVYVGPHGAAQSVGFSSGKTVIADAWAECAEKAALAWRLTDPRGQVAKLAIRYRAR
jgi:hypothetical protein